MLILFPPSGALCGVGIAVLIAVCAFLKFLGCVANPREVSAVIMLPGCRVPPICAGKRPSASVRTGPGLCARKKVCLKTIFTNLAFSHFWGDNFLLSYPHKTQVGLGGVGDTKFGPMKTARFSQVKASQDPKRSDSESYPSCLLYWEIY
jgi:hypothetical protein